MNHNYSDSELLERVVGLADHDLAVIENIYSEDHRCIKFIIRYSGEGFFSDLLEVRQDKAVGWFLKEGYLYVYRSNY